MTILYVLSSIGGATAFFAAVFTVVRAIAHQVSSTEDNTDALHQLTDKVTKILETQDRHGRDIAWLMGRQGRPPNQ